MVGYIYSYKCKKKESKYYGWVYVGQTRNKKGFAERHRQHLQATHGNSFFDRTIQKLGKDAFDFKIEREIECGTEEELVNELNWHERNFIILYGSFVELGHGFNLTTGGESYVMSEDVKQKISVASNKMWQNHEHRKKMIECATKMWQNDEHRKNVSDAMKKRYSSHEERRRTSEAIKKGQSTYGVRQKMSDFQKKRFSDPEERRKMSERVKKMWENEDYRKKASEHTTKMWENEDYRKKCSEAIKKSLSNPSVRQKMSDFQKKRYEDPEEHRKISEHLKGRINIKPCILFDIKTERIYYFKSHQEAGELLGINRCKICQYQTKPYKNRWVCITNTDSEVDVESIKQMVEDRKMKMKKEKIERQKGKGIKPCRLFDLETNKHIIFKSRQEASEFVGMRKNYIYLYTSKPYKGRYLFIPD